MEVGRKTTQAARARTRARPEPAGSTPRRRRRRLVEGVLVAIGCLVLLDTLAGEQGLVEMLRTRQERQTLEQTLHRVRAQNRRLREQADWLHTDAGVEDLARRELGLIKPGERLYTVRDAGPGSAPSGDRPGAETTAD